MDDTFYQVVAIPVINGLIEVAKMAGLAKRYCPLLAVGLGILLSAGIKGPQETWVQAVIDGVIIGLSAVGLYSGGRTVIRWNDRKLG